jgi:ComF family protein
MIEQILSLIAPHECLGCGLEGRLLCGQCANQLPEVAARCYRCYRLSPGFKTCSACRRVSKVASVKSVTYHEKLARQLVWKFKFDNAQAAAAEMAKLMESAVDKVDNLPSVITHAPTATSRIRYRGYDQAQLLAKAVARQTGLPYQASLRRMGQHRQVGASRSQRVAQLKEAFRPINTSGIWGARIILIDDVLTTGATLEAAATVLKTAGAKRIDGLVFSRA